MATIIEFQRRARLRSQSSPKQRNQEMTGEVVIFPGVRIERREGEAIVADGAVDVAPKQKERLRD